MPRIKNNGVPPIKNEHKVENKTDGVTRDKATYDTGVERYSWDVYKDAQGDRRGKVAVGHDDGTNDIYAKLDFNEDTGHLKGSVGGERHVTENLDMRGEYGRYLDGDQYGEAGATIKSKRGSLAVDVGGNERTGRIFGKLKGRYKVGDNTTLRGKYSNDNKKSALWSLGARHRIATRNHVDGEFGVSRSLGRFAKGEWLRKYKGGAVRDHLEVEHSAKKGLKASYEGLQKFDDGEIKEKVTYADGRLKAEAKGKLKTEDGHLKGATHFERRDDGRWSGDVGGEIKDDNNLYGGRVRKDLSGTKKLKGFYGRELSETLDAKVTGNVDSKGRWDLTGEADKELANDFSLKEKFTIDSKGKRTYTHKVTKSFPDNKARIGAELMHDSDGAKKLSVDGGITTDGNDRHEVDASYGVDKKGVRSAKVGYDFDNRDGFKAGVDLGMKGEGRSVGLDMKREHENKRGSDKLDLDWSTDKGFRAKGAVSRKLGEDSEISGSVSRNFRTGDVGAEGAFATMAGEDDDLKLRVGLKASTTNSARGVDVGLSREATAEKLGFGVNAGFETNDKRERFDLGGSLSGKSFFGLDETLKAGFGGGVQATKRSAVKNLSKLRKEALSDAPEGSGFVRYGMKANAKVDVGMKIPIGLAYVDTGYKHGSSYEVEFTSLETDPKLGTRPDIGDMKIPGNASELLSMKTGESFAIKGGTQHAVRGGGGLGTAIGTSAIGSVDARVGAKLTYAIKGNTRTEVTRGGDNSARMVVKATDTKTKGGGMEIFVGLNPNLPKIDGIGPIGDVATGLAKGMIKKWVSVGASMGKEKTTGDERLLDARIDLSHVEAKSAYETAMKGDWSEIERLSEAGHPGVQIDKSIISDIKAETKNFELAGFGMSYDQESGEALKSSDVTYKGRDFEVESDLDTDKVTKDGWFVDKDFKVQDFTRTVSAEDGGSLGTRKADEHWLGWSASKSDSFSSKEEVAGQLALARFVAGEDQSADLSKYGKKIGKLKEHRKLWLGPRNELRTTEVKTEIMLSDSALDRLSGKSSDEIWAAMSTAKLALSGDKPAPDWADPSKRMGLVAGLGDFDPFTRLSGDSANLFEKRSFDKASDFVSRLSAASKLPEEQRNDAIRGALASRPRDPVAIATMVELLGRDAVDMKVSVDSDAGKKGSEYDLNFSLRGSQYNVQKTVFGANL
ncbi:MAG: hypothetical protein OSB21_04920 [Myxococcota bacterium]|nr:hypothetical protein [Myxococcota bacterium]